jgi:hypothetical protein
MKTSMASMFSFGEPYKSAEEASKAKRSSLLYLFAIIAVLSAVGLFVWYGSTLNTKAIFSGWPNLDGLILLILGAVLYYRFSRTGAVIVLVLALLKLLVHWAATGFGAPPGISVLVAVAAAQVTMTAFKVHEWEKNNSKLPRPKCAGLALAGASVLALVALVFPPVHLFYHINKHTSLTENGNSIVYQDSGDMYLISFPNTWQKVRPTDDFYGSVAFTPKDNASVRIEVERWEPWSVAAITLTSRDAFLKTIQDESAQYATENNLTVQSVEMIGSDKVNEARAIYAGADGSKQYTYYLYNRMWSRQTSNAIFYFWRLTAFEPKDAQAYDADIQLILNSFKVI